MHLGCHRDHHDLHARWVADRPAPHQGLPDRERQRLLGVRQGVLRDLVRQARRERRRPAGQSSAWASSPD